MTTANPIKELATFYDTQYTAHMGVRYPFNNGKDAKLLKDLRSIYSDEDIQRYMTAFFELDDDFVQQSGYGLGAFRGCLPKVIASMVKARKPDDNGHYPQCVNRHECIARVIRDGRTQQAGPVRVVK